ncbi:MAG: NADH:flavin oxidoreductase [Deltaproteobacteria bacterium]|nr:NADH:flavin oxidoreductase [Deltaproteobacteria bacterium]
MNRMEADPKHMLAFQAGKLGPLQLRNRFIRCAAFEGMTPAGQVSPMLIAHHKEQAAGGAAMTTVAYCSVAKDGLTFADQMVMDNDRAKQLRPLTDAVHAEGAAAALQIGHAGYFGSKRASGVKPLGASRVFCTYTVTWPKVAGPSDLDRLVEDFGRSARLASEAGFDAVELHLGHGYLLSQFLTPYTNRRKDEYGGSLENRLRFPLRVLTRVREALGTKCALLVKTNLEDGFKGGLDVNESAIVVQALKDGGADAVVLSGGFVSRTPFYMLRGELPIAEMLRNEKDTFRKLGLKLFGRIMVDEYEFEPMFFFEPALRVRKAVRDFPLVLLGGIRSLKHLKTAEEAGFEFVSLGRPLIMEPDLINRMARGESQASLCEPCNKCVGEMENGGIRCAHPELGKKSTSLWPFGFGTEPRT